MNASKPRWSTNDDRTARFLKFCVLCCQLQLRCQPLYLPPPAARTIARFDNKLPPVSFVLASFFSSFSGRGTHVSLLALLHFKRFQRLFPKKSSERMRRWHSSSASSTIQAASKELSGDAVPRGGHGSKIPTSTIMAASTSTDGCLAAFG